MALRDRDEIIAFKNAAAQYCSIIESEPTDIDTWGEELLLSLSMMYAYGGLLPPENSFPDDFPNLPDEYIISHDEWTQLFGKLSLILHPQRSDWKCHSCADTTEHHEISGILADNLVDIYHAIKPGLRAWDSGVSEYLPSILFEWKLGYRTNWGFDAVEALKELHPLVYSVGFKNTT